MLFPGSESRYNKDESAVIAQQSSRSTWTKPYHHCMIPEEEYATSQTTNIHNK